MEVGEGNGAGKVHIEPGKMINDHTENIDADPLSVLFET